MAQRSGTQDEEDPARVNVGMSNKFQEEPQLVGVDGAMANHVHTEYQQVQVDK